MKRIKFSILIIALATFLAPGLNTLTARAATAGDMGPNIIGGGNATQQYGAVSLWSLNPHRHRCTGALIAPTWILTAAHCTSVINVGVAEIHASSLDNTKNFELVTIAAVHVHPNFDPELLKNDLALIQLSDPIKHTEPLHLTTTDAGVGTTGKVAGWGWTCEDLSNPACGHAVNILQQLDLKVTKANFCPAMWDPDNELCMVSANNTFAMACFGDSGGPLVKESALGGFDVIGITSYDGDDWNTSFGCRTNSSGTPGSGVFMKVSRYIDWIKGVISPAVAVH